MGACQYTCVIIGVRRALFACNRVSRGEYNPRWRVASYRRAAFQVWAIVRPLSFSSRLIRMAAAETPMNKAKIGSATREMM